jgi:hypothetical protein
MGLGASPNFLEFFKNMTNFRDLEIFQFSTFVYLTLCFLDVLDNGEHSGGNDFDQFFFHFSHSKFLGLGIFSTIFSKKSILFK